MCAASARLATFGVLAADDIDADLAQLAVKEAVVGAATEFAVRRELQPHALLQPQRVLYGFVFGLGQLRPVDFVTREFCALIEQLAWPQQATDMLSMEWRRLVRQHRRQASLGIWIFDKISHRPSRDDFPVPESWTEPTRPGLRRNVIPH